MNSIIMFAADILVGVLLVATIVSSVRLSRRISGLKADEAAMRTTIVELVTASEAAERAVGGLRGTLADCERTLADRIEVARRQADELGRKIAAGEAVVGGIERFVETTRRAVEAHPRPAAIAEPAAAPVPPAAPVAQPPKSGQALRAALAAAQAVADRTARRVESRAA